MNVNTEQMTQDENHLDQMMQEVMSLDPHAILAIVPGSQLDKHIKDPVVEQLKQA